MIQLETTDNNLGKSIRDLGCPTGEAPSVYRDLSAIADIPLKDLCAKTPSLLVFPERLGDSDDGIDELSICELSGASDAPENAKVTTGNLMGFVGYGNTQLAVRSRFSIDDTADCFLHYMLEKVGLVNLFDLQYGKDRDRYFDFLLYLFPAALRKALSQGLFKCYRSFERNDANVKGVVAVSRHIRQNVPFAGRISYNTRERSYDNFVTELVRHTIEFIRTKPNGKFVLFGNEETKKAVSEIVQATGSYSSRERERIIRENGKPLNHPYFTAYRPLQKLCLAILRHHRLAYRKDSQQVYGILFDGAWLWEEYLATILKENGFLHPRNKVSTGGIRMFDNSADEQNFDRNYRRIYPDFYRPNGSDKGGCILDAKYKRLQNGVGREDLYQVISYMHTMAITQGGFIYPIAQSGSDSGGKVIIPQHYKLASNGGYIHVLGLRIPKVGSEADFRTRYDGFREKMRNLEESLSAVNL